MNWQNMSYGEKCAVVIFSFLFIPVAILAAMTTWNFLLDVLREGMMREVGLG